SRRSRSIRVRAPHATSCRKTLRALLHEAVRPKARTRPDDEPNDRAFRRKIETLRRETPKRRITAPRFRECRPRHAPGKAPRGLPPREDSAEVLRPAKPTEPHQARRSARSYEVRIPDTRPAKQAHDEISRLPSKRAGLLLRRIENDSSSSRPHP